MMMVPAALAIRLMVVDTAGSWSVRLSVNEVVEQMRPGSQHRNRMVAAEQDRIDLAPVVQQARCRQHADHGVGREMGVARTVREGKSDACVEHVFRLS